MRTPETVVDEESEKDQFIDGVKLLKIRDAEWEEAITRRLREHRFCPDCGWQGQRTDHYCERCKTSVAVSQSWEEESIAQLISNIKASGKAEGERE